jgi:chaperone modulatory protein CbpM
MRDDEVLIGDLLEETWMHLEQVAAACRVEPAWLLQHIDDGLLPHVESAAGLWRFSSTAVLRTRRMLQVERDFDAGPELAALVADLLEEIDTLRAKIQAGQR